MSDTVGLILVCLFLMSTCTSEGLKFEVNDKVYKFKIGSEEK